MSKTDCLNQPANEKLIIIRQWQLKACNGDDCAAALLNHFAYWHNIKLEQLSQAKSHNNTAERHGERRSQMETLLQWHRSEDLQNSLLIYGRKRIHDAIVLLEKLGFISVHKNPNPSYAFDKTKFFLFHPENVNDWLANKYNSLKQDENPELDPAIEFQKQGSDLADLCRSDSTNSADGPHKLCERTAQIDHCNIQRIQTEITDRNYTQEKACELAKYTFTKSSFEIFWQTWTAITQKSLKQEATHRIFESLIKTQDDPLLEIILQALENQSLEKQLRQQHGLFVATWPDPDNWLKEMRWQDATKTDLEALRDDFARQMHLNPRLQQEMIKQRREKFLDEDYRQRLGDRADATNFSREQAISKIEAEFQRNRSHPKNSWK